MTRIIKTTHDLLYKAVLATSSSSIIFSGIPQNYSDLIIRTNFFSGGNPVRAVVRVNGDSGSNYPLVYLDYPTASNSETNTYFSFGYYSSGADSTRPQMHSITIFDYSAADKHKPALMEGGNSNDRMSKYNMRWSNNSPITSLEIFPINGGSFLANSIFSIYGVM